MAYTEKLLPVSDLFAAWQNRRAMELQDNGAAKERENLQNRLLQEQVKAAEWENVLSKERPTITLPAGPGLGGMREKQFLDQQAGYISGTKPADVFNQWQQNFRTGMTAGGGRGGGGGGGEDAANTRSDPYSNYTPNQLAEQNAINEYQPQQNKKTGDSATIATELAKLYGRGGEGGAPQSDLGGGGIKDHTGTYKGFYQEPIGDTGRVVNASGAETITGTKPAGEYQAGVAGAEDVEKILREREAAPGKMEAAKAKVLNQAATSIAADPRFKSLTAENQKKILENVGTEVENNIKTRGTPILDIADLIKRYTNPDVSYLTPPIFRNK